MYCTSLVVKVASLCNLNCSYCYVYNKGDESYKLQPKIMSLKTVKMLLENVRRHCLRYELKRFLIIFHGGEPLLTGVAFYEEFININKEIFQNENIEIRFSMQTNGVLLNKEIVEKLKILKISIGISLDGTPSSNNINRVYHSGKGSYKEILRGFNLVKEVYGEKAANCLCVIDLNEKEEDVYNHFKEIGVNEVNLLIPDYNYFNKPLEKKSLNIWLINVFELWVNDLSKIKPKIMIFSDLIGLILGNSDFGTEMYGKRQNRTVVIETNGDIEPVDTLKICGNGFTKTKINVIDNELNEIYDANDIAKKYYFGHSNLSDKCKKCPVENICGGGFIGHRYSEELMFNNPTIYCEDMAKLICHIQNYIYDKLSTEYKNQYDKLIYEDIKEYIET